MNTTTHQTDYQTQLIETAWKEMNARLDTLLNCPGGAEVLDRPSLEVPLTVAYVTTSRETSAGRACLGRVWDIARCGRCVQVRIRVSVVENLAGEVALIPADVRDVLGIGVPW